MDESYNSAIGTRDTTELLSPNGLDEAAPWTPVEFIFLLVRGDPQWMLRSKSN